MEGHTSAASGGIAVARRLTGPVGVAALAACGCVAIWACNPTVPGGPLPVCPIKALLGIDCPGCGGLRMIYSLLHGDVWAALRFNAVGLVAVFVLVWSYVAWTYGRVAGREIRSWQHHRWSAPIVLVVVLVWFVVRNLGFGPFTALYV
jgi:hypothetical protein